MPTDEHEFTILPNGAAVVVAYAPVRWNLAAAGGPRTGIALDCAVQEVDIRTGLVMWEWRSLGHVEVSQSYSPPPTSPTGYYDYFHVNSAQLLGDDSFLLSARNTWGVYDVNAHTGAIVWQLGGKASTFALGPGVQFAYQHNARLLPNGEVSVYDDEGAPPVNPPARGEVVKIDTSARTAVLASAFVRKPGLLTTCCGNVQQLSGDRWMVGWGGLPNFTEFDAEGNAIFDAQYPRGEFNYRVYRDTWKGQPLTPPSVLVKLAPAPSACPPGAKCPLQLGPTAYASWNGATEVTSWQLLAGSSARHMKAISTVPKTGFETEIPAPGRNTFYAVRALSSTGRVLGTSRIVRASAR
jgi:hypothetical protein